MKRLLLLIIFIMLTFVLTACDDGCLDCNDDPEYTCTVYYPDGSEVSYPVRSINSFGSHGTKLYLERDQEDYMIVVTHTPVECIDHD